MASDKYDNGDVTLITSDSGYSDTEYLTRNREYSAFKRDIFKLQRWESIDDV